MTAGASAGWRVLNTSVRGSRHARTGQPCQDANCWQTLAGWMLVAAVADGAGSASAAEFGAQVAASAAVARVAQLLGKMIPDKEEEWRTVLREGLRTARDAVVAEASARALDPPDLATTLILVVATPQLIAAAQVGDGAIVARRSNGLLLAVTRPPIGEYANETTFITSGQAVDTAQFSVEKTLVTGVVLLSDGLQLLALKMPEGEPYEPFFEPLLDFAADADDLDRARGELAAFLQSDRVAERTDDDLTLLLAVCAATAQSPETPASLVQG